MDTTEAVISLKRILFATDFSPEADKARGYITVLARHCGAQVQIIHVVDSSAAFKVPDSGLYFNIFRESGEQNLAKEKEKFISAGVQAETRLHEAVKPAEAIVQAVNAEAADLIAIGTRGRNDLGRLAIGSVAEYLIRHTRCPVLTAGPHAKPSGATGGFQRIVCATDFSPEAAAATRFAIAFAQNQRAHMFLCHVLPPPNPDHPMNTQQLLENFGGRLLQLIPEAAREWCEPECIVDHGYARDGILLLAQRVKADLIIFGTRRFSHWFTDLRAGIAFGVMRSAACPVLTILRESES